MNNAIGTSPVMNFHVLPPEILVEILTFCPHNVVIKCSTVSKDFFDAEKSRYLWETHYINRFNVKYTEKEPNVKQKYLIRYFEETGQSDRIPKKLFQKIRKLLGLILRESSVLGVRIVSALGSYRIAKMFRDASSVRILRR